MIRIGLDVQKKRRFGEIAYLSHIREFKKRRSEGFSATIRGMKPLGLMLMFISLGVCACQDNRVSALEKRVADLEKKVQTLEASNKADADAVAQKELDFKNCVQQANDDYMTNVRNNGTKTRTGYSVDTRVMPEIERQKQSKIEECKLLYR
jgi:hypothetical protein